MLMTSIFVFCNMFVQKEILKLIRLVQFPEPFHEKDNHEVLKP